ncbi:S-adenosyl-L-methionine-dependent methyltransferase [Xylariales sp. PMI_506]|nr:S-adenosyl-L-methionine-dependent methyltransferase [Xylariales sp. PMI_506]
MAPPKAEDIEEENDTLFTAAQIKFLERFRNIGHSRSRPIIIPNDENIEDVVAILEDEVEDEINEQFDLKEEEDEYILLEERRSAGRTQDPRSQPQPQIQRNETSIISQYTTNRITMRIGDMVEFDPPLDCRYFRARFLKILKIFSTESGVQLHGTPYTRTRNTIGMLDALKNEIVEILDTDEDDKTQTISTGVSIPASSVICLKGYQATNALWPEFGNAESDGVLTHRWTIINYYYNAERRRTGRVVARSLQRVAAKDLPFGYLRRSDPVILNNYRGGKKPGGSYPDGMVIDIEQGANTVSHGQKYTFCDLFCGARGTSRGAKDAGFRVTLACDIWDAACRTYRKNFPETDLRQMNVFDMMTLMGDTEIRIDVLHLSPPCQVWSPAHTVPGQNDEMNLAALYSAFEIVKKLRPRLITLEQTFGILAPAFKNYFHLLLNCFTSHGYSLTWRLVALNTWGVPQPRRRLILIASCPGEQHPDFPATITAPLSVEQALRTIGPRATLHNVGEMLAQARLSGRYPRAPWDATGLLRNTITCDGGGENNYHPSGERGLTLREFAALQGFPSHHKFEPPAIKKQIGNAFPPSAVRWLYSHLRRHLLRVDNVVEDPEMDDSVIIV